jgi:hypothetical protein
MALDQLVFDSESDGEDIRRPLNRSNEGDEGEEEEDDGRDISEAEEAPEKGGKKKDDAEVRVSMGMVTMPTWTQMACDVH